MSLPAARTRAEAATKELKRTWQDLLTRWDDEVITVHDQDRNRAHRSRTLSHPRGLRANGRPYSKSHVRMPRGVELVNLREASVEILRRLRRQTKKLHRSDPNHKHDLIEKLQHWRSHTPTNDGRNTRTRRNPKNRRFKPLRWSTGSGVLNWSEPTESPSMNLSKKKPPNLFRTPKSKKQHCLKPRKNRFGWRRPCLSLRKTSPAKNLP